MRLLVSFLLLTLTSCGGGWEERYALGRERDGARYYSGWIFGGPSLSVYPDGRVIWRYDSGDKQPIAYLDSKLWAQLVEIAKQDSGVELVDIDTEEGAMCDGGEAEAYFRLGDLVAYYQFDGMGCDRTIKKSDKAGREIFEILEALSNKLEKRARDIEGS